MLLLNATHVVIAVGEIRDCNGQTYAEAEGEHCEADGWPHAGDPLLTGTLLAVAHVDKSSITYLGDANAEQEHSTAHEKGSR